MFFWGAVAPGRMAFMPLLPLSRPAAPPGRPLLWPALRLTDEIAPTMPAIPLPPLPRAAARLRRILCPLLPCCPTKMRRFQPVIRFINVYLRL